METPEKEFAKLKPVVDRFCRFFLMGKKLEIRGGENFVKTGPNIIVGNHVGTFKDIAIILQVVPRTIFFTANKMLFNKDEFNWLVRNHLNRHLKTFGYFVDLLLNPFKVRFIHFISSNITRVGTIPVDLTRQKKLAIEKCQDYLKKGRAIIALQGKGRVVKDDPNPYVSPFRGGPSFLAYNLYMEDHISVPVTPVAMFGTQLPFLIPNKIKVSVGEPMFISDHMAEGITASVEKFRVAMERKVRDLLMELIRI
jgi:1-acyl-sn-glycerol-3-phosphate acyltransferase